MSDDRTADAVIVVGLDGSDTSWDAFSWAAPRGPAQRARLLAAYVSPRPGAGAAVVGGAYDYGAVDRARAEVAADRPPPSPDGRPNWASTSNSFTNTEKRAARSPRSPGPPAPGSSSSAARPRRDTT